MNLKKFAVYVTPDAARKIGQVPERRRFVPTHTAYVPSPGHVLEHLMGDIVHARVDGREVTIFKDFLSIIDTSTTTTTTTTTMTTTTSATPDESTANIDDKLASWVNDWTREQNGAAFASAVPTKATVGLASEISSWLDSLLGYSTSTSTSAFAFAPASTKQRNISTRTVNACMLSTLLQT